MRFREARALASKSLCLERDRHERLAEEIAGAGSSSRATSSRQSAAAPILVHHRWTCGRRQVGRVRRPRQHLQPASRAGHRLRPFHGGPVAGDAWEKQHHRRHGVEVTCERRGAQAPFSTPSRRRPERRVLRQRDEPARGGRRRFRMRPTDARRASSSADEDRAVRRFECHVRPGTATPTV